MIVSFAPSSAAWNISGFEPGVGVGVGDGDGVGVGAGAAVDVGVAGADEREPPHPTIPKNMRERKKMKKTDKRDMGPTSKLRFL
jgi:hypothetical protein